MVTKIEILQSWFGLPVYFWQGLGVRRRSIRMAPPPQKPVVELKGKGKSISILFIGDSSCAGVGVDDFEESVAGRLPHLLKKLTGRPIHQRTAGNNSATAGQLRDLVVPNLEHRHYDFVVFSIGVNDAKNFHTSRRFKKEFGGFLYALHARFPEATLVWQGLLDMEGIPVLPSPLKKILGIRSRVLKKQGEQLCFERSALSPPTKWQPLPQNFSRDGFHASSEGYRVWAEELAEYLAELSKE
ncbi:MAG: SGNH/GDSL hydrolase family protein [Rhizobiaceae bacterium]|nr:SGNH/GDSL hydrolase family protein [Rhizobiaceae bacterium]